jgi:hypothetical protein
MPAPSSASTISLRMPNSAKVLEGVGSDSGTVICAVVLSSSAACALCSVMIGF